MLGHGAVGLEWAVAQVIGDWTPAPTGVCVADCKAVGLHGKGTRCATVREMWLHGRRLCMKRTRELGRKRRS